MNSCLGLKGSSDNTKKLPGIPLRRLNSYNVIGNDKRDMRRKQKKY
nr:MAG TPA: hypothetical protein [Herelleviridae sp.]